MVVFLHTSGIHMMNDLDGQLQEMCERLSRERDGDKIAELRKEACRLLVKKYSHTESAESLSMDTDA